VNETLVSCGEIVTEGPGVREASCTVTDAPGDATMLTAAGSVTRSVSKTVES